MAVVGDPSAGRSGGLRARACQKADQAPAGHRGRRTALGTVAGVAGMPREAVADGATFQLDRFEWAAPDRLEIAGSFAGVDAPTVTPTLVVGSGDGVRRL